MTLTTRLGQFLSVLVAGVFIASAAQAEDTVRFVNDKGSIEEAKGTIGAESSLEVTIGAKKIPVYQIRSVRYDFKPPEVKASLGLALAGIEAGNYQSALDRMNDLAVPNSLTAVKAQIEVAKYRAKAMMALADPTKAKVALDAYEKLVNDKIIGSQSRHLYPTVELQGRLLLSLNRSTEAITAFKKLAESNWPGYRQKAQSLEGEVLLKQGKYADAIKLFDAVALGGDGVPAMMQASAKALRADARVQSGNAKVAETELKSLIADESIRFDTSPEAKAVLAVAHNALGDAYKATGKPKEAILDGYMWTYVMYNVSPEQTARALYNLSILFNKTKDRDKADQMRAQLMASYGNTDWAKKLNEK